MRKTQHGFTLIELSIVLVIIGLIAAGVLVGRDLIRAAGVRATISQIEKYNTAVHAFQAKYDRWLPGDIPNPYASMFGFQTRGQYKGEGDGDGVLSGVTIDAPSSNFSGVLATGEEAMFWVDLSTAGLVDGGFHTATPSTIPITNILPTGIPNYMPAAKLGGGNSIYTFSFQIPGSQDNGIWAITNYYGISVFASNAAGCGSCVMTQYGQTNPTVGLTTAQAYSIDKKIDDGNPFTGAVVALNMNTWSGTAFGQGQGGFPAITPSSTTCFDNNGVAWATVNYSVQMDGGNDITCALLIRFQ